MKLAPSFDDVFTVMSAASVGEMAARVAVPEDAQLDDTATKFAIALNILLDDLAARAEAAPTWTHGPSLVVSLSAKALTTPTLNAGSPASSARDAWPPAWRGRPDPLRARPRPSSGASPHATDVVAPVSRASRPLG